jgi:hypothetical protein
MQVLIVQPGQGTLNGIDLQRFRPGFVYEMGATMASLFIREGWGEPFSRTVAESTGMADDRPPRPPRKRQR